MMRFFLCLLVMTGPAFAEARSSAKFLTPRKVVAYGMISPTCGSLPLIESSLRDNWSERLVWTRFANSALRYQYWESPKTWSFVQVNQNGIACVMTAGQIVGQDS